MKHQSDLFNPPTSTITDPLDIEPTHFNNSSKRDLRAETEQWMKKHQEVYQMFVRFAFQAASKGKRFGIGLIAERVRWECQFETDYKYKISNSFRAYIARKLVQDYPELRKYLTFRDTRC